MIESNKIFQSLRYEKLIRPIDNMQKKIYLLNLVLKKEMPFEISPLEKMDNDFVSFSTRLLNRRVLSQSIIRNDSIGFNSFNPNNQEKNNKESNSFFGTIVDGIKSILHLITTVQIVLNDLSIEQSIELIKTKQTSFDYNTFQNIEKDDIYQSIVARLLSKRLKKKHSKLDVLIETLIIRKHLATIFGFTDISFEDDFVKIVSSHHGYTKLIDTLSRAENKKNNLIIEYNKIIESVNVFNSLFKHNLSNSIAELYNYLLHTTKIDNSINVNVTDDDVLSLSILNYLTNDYDKNSILHEYEIQEIISNLNKIIESLENDISILKKNNYISYVLSIKNPEKYFIQQKNLLQAKLNANCKHSEITKEISTYSKYIQSIENPNFEKIRRYCSNLVDDNQADDIQKYLAENGKMHKALIYSVLETFIEKLDGDTITLVDWGCGQGMGSMLVFDYIKEKQLNIKVNQVLLIDTDEKILSRAMVGVKTLDFDNAKIEAFKSSDNNISATLKTIKNNTTLNLFTNDKMPVDYLDIDFDLLKNAYFMCVSNENKEFVDEVYEKLKSFKNSQNLSIRDGKIGKFSKFERVFKI